jgi:hypothetical protein
MESNSNKTIAIVFGVLVLLVLVIFFAANSGGGGGGGGGAAGGGTPSSNTASTTEDNTQPSTPKDQSQATMGESFDAETSADVPTVTEVRGDLEDRGLQEALLTADFSIDGSYSSPMELEQDSNDKYPSYLAQYMSASDIPWYIYINNGSYFARPMVEIGSSTHAPIIVSETDYVTEYDGNDNTFMNAIPTTNTLILVKVNHIDKTTLDDLTQAELDKIWGAQ